ncbi:BrnT family toxin [Cyanobacterium aponinum UTEX 3222]|uniref:BrnT family toxin n=1 Tax=Cyanobacterium aponinum TaxID=379064 RepID=UPI0030915CAF|nr:BrnT family toxin [Cyanobacterium aponinum UTEX 3222]
MDLILILNGITFIWNEEKAKQNPIKHKGITFEKAVEAFFDPFLVVVDAVVIMKPEMRLSAWIKIITSYLWFIFNKKMI